MEEIHQSSSNAFDNFEGIIKKHFENPDIEAAKVIFACIAAHRIEDHPPTWAMAIAPPGSMKTAILESLHGLPSIYFIDELTDKTFISGKIDQVGKKRKTPASYLHRIGKEGILISADFGTIMSMDRRIRNTVLAQLRRIYDGHFSREFGTDENTEERTWEGRLTLIAGSTPEIDNHHSLFQALGERFIRVRWPRAGGVDAGLRAIRQAHEVKEQLLEVTSQLMKPLLDHGPVEAPIIEPEWELRLASYSEIVALGRAHVPRSRDDREIIGIPQPEGNTRLAQELAQVGRGWAVLNNRTEIDEEEYALIERAGFDCIPPVRKQALVALIQGKSPYSSGSPESSVNRALEDLEAIGLTTRSNKTWELSEKAVKLLDLCFPHCAYT